MPKFPLSYIGGIGVSMSGLLIQSAVPHTSGWSASRHKTEYTFYTAPVTPAFWRGPRNVWGLQSPQNCQSSNPKRILASAAGELGELKRKLVPSGKNQTK